MFSSEELLHAIDLATIHDFDGAKAIFERIDDPIADRLLFFVQDIEQRIAARRNASAALRHEIGNALSIAQANLEGIVDGVLAPDRDRLVEICAALSGAGKLLDKMKHLPERPLPTRVTIETFGLCSLVATQYALVVGRASAKGVRVVFNPAPRHDGSLAEFRGDASRVAQIVRNVFVTTIRNTRPGGTIEIACDGSNGNVKISVREWSPGVSAETLRAIGPEVVVFSQEPNGVTFVVALPATPMATAS